MFDRDLIFGKFNSLHHQAKNLLLRFKARVIGRCADITTKLLNSRRQCGRRCCPWRCCSIEAQHSNGQCSQLSKIMGHTSGGETQTPFYLTIAASFLHLYRIGDGLTSKSTTVIRIWPPAGKTLPISD
jgi:hypothetical protein